MKEDKVLSFKSQVFLSVAAVLKKYQIFVSLIYTSVHLTYEKQHCYYTKAPAERDIYIKMYLNNCQFYREMSL